MFDEAYARGTRSVLLSAPAVTRHCCLARRLASALRLLTNFRVRCPSSLCAVPPSELPLRRIISTSVFVLRHIPLLIRRRRRRLAAEDSPVSDASGADLDGADTLLDTVGTPGQSGGAAGAGGAGARNDPGNGPVDEEEEEDDGDISDPPPMEYNADRDREIDEDPDHSDGEDGAGAGEEVRACVHGYVCDDHNVVSISGCARGAFAGMFCDIHSARNHINLLSRCVRGYVCDNRSVIYQVKVFSRVGTKTMSCRGE